MIDVWQERVVAVLLDLKADGLPFEGAWSIAMTTHPPRGRDCGPVRPTLLDQDTSLVGFFKRACDDAWHGRRPALLHFHPTLLMDLDRSEPASRARRRLAA